MRNLFLLIGVVFFMACNSDDDTPDDSVSGLDEKNSVKYKVEMTFDWNTTNFPTDFPSNDHF